MALMHVNQSMSTSHYHDFNGAVECLNKTVEVMLRHLFDEFPDADFVDLLPMAQWAYNTSLHRGSSMTPYYALYGVDPLQPMQLAAAAGGRQHPAAALFAQHQAGILAMAKDALNIAHEAMEAYENRSRQEASFKVGEHVFLSTANLGSSHFSRSSAKLRPQYMGPFRIDSKIGEHRYRLQLPRSMKELHPEFHPSLLKRAVESPPELAGRLGAGVTFPVEVATGEGTALLTHDDDGVPVYVVEKVIARRKRGKGFQYLVKWTGYEAEHNSWIARSNMDTTGGVRMLDEFDAAQQA
jgi:hypothetical protein